MTQISEAYERAGNLKFLAERSRIPEQRENFLRQARIEEEKAKALLTQSKVQPSVKRKEPKNSLPQRRQPSKVKFQGKLVSYANKNLGRGIRKLASAFVSSPKQKVIRQRTALRRTPSSYGNISNLNYRDVASMHELMRQRKLLQDTEKNNYLSENTKQQLQRLLEIQTLGHRRNMEMQRVHRERRVLSNASNLLKTPSLFGKDSATFDYLDTKDNILNAPSVFKEQPDSNRTKRFNILQTKEAGNNLFF